MLHLGFRRSCRQTTPLRSRLPVRPVLGILVLFGMGGCTRPTETVVLSSGTAGGYYSRLGEQIVTASRTAVGLTVRNQPSQGSRQNLQQLLDRQVDFALVQLDVASEAMRQGKVEAVAVLGNEHIHILTVQGNKLRSFEDLQNQRVSLGSQGSGIRFTADRLLRATQLKLNPDSASFDQVFDKLRQRQLDAAIYVGSVGASEKLRQEFNTNPALRLIPMRAGLINYLITRDPGAYRAAKIPVGTYGVTPTIPNQDIDTLATPTVLITRPDLDDRTVGLVTWAILDTSRKFASFYPELQTGEARSLLQQGLFYIHRAAQRVYEQGDPREAWIRYWENNSDLQAGLVILVGTSSVGLFLQQWRRDRAKKLINITLKRINELKQLLPQDAQQALTGMEELSQEHRLMFIEGSISSDVYDQVQQKTQMFAEQCRTILEEQRRQFVMDTLLLLDDWQALLQDDPQAAMQKLTQIKQQYREMLLADQVDIKAYIELMELTLISVMTLVPKSSPHSFNPNSTDGIH